MKKNDGLTAAVLFTAACLCLGACEEPETVTEIPETPTPTPAKPAAAFPLKNAQVYNSDGTLYSGNAAILGSYFVTTPGDDGDEAVRTAVYFDAGSISAGLLTISMPQSLDGESELDPISDMLNGEGSIMPVDSRACMIQFIVAGSDVTVLEYFKKTSTSADKLDYVYAGTKASVALIPGLNTDKMLVYWDLKKGWNVIHTQGQIYRLYADDPDSLVASVTSATNSRTAPDDMKWVLSVETSEDIIISK
ncbi:MAG: hypothetical protein LBB22_03815 [Treponema sp.]|nr:hypothetical protein [Treponema sp.]